MKSGNWIILVVGVIFLISLNSCEDEKVESPEKDATSNFYELMQTWYLWYDEMPDIDLSDYNTPEEVLKTVRSEKDKWSYITTVEKFEDYIKEAAFTGYGFGYGTDPDGNIRITFTFEESPLRDYGIKRSWIIKSINGETPDSPEDVSNLLGSTDAEETSDFTIISPSGADTVKETFTSKEITRNTVLHSSIINTNSGKTGYMVLNSFVEKTSKELFGVFQSFSEENIENIVIDLRYNGGGMLSRANELADYLIDDSHIDDIFIKIMHNDKKQDQNNYHYFKQDSLSLDWSLPEIYFITTGSTASASEALINGLKPYKNVYTIGTETYGKPVGMYGFYDNKEYYAFLPVCFRIANAKDLADYYGGIPVDVEEQDDITQAFGDTQEACLKQAINHIEEGSFLRGKALRNVKQRELGSSYRKEMIILKSKQRR